MAATPLIQCRSLSKSFTLHPLFAEITLGFFEGERMGLIGPNGSGKSTLLKILAGLETPDAGEMTRKRDTLLVYLPQADELDPEKTVEQSLLDAVGNPAEAPALFRETIRQMQFERTDRRVGTLSGGWRKRLAIARALIQEPDLLLMDEPSRPSRAAETEKQVRGSLMSSAALVLVVAIPLSVLSIHFVGETRLRGQVQSAVVAELVTRPGSQLVDIAILGDTPDLHLLVTIRSPIALDLAEASSLQEALAVRLQRPLLLELVVIPTTRLSPKLPPTLTPTSIPGSGVMPARTQTVTITPSAVNGGVGFRCAPVGEVHGVSAERLADGDYRQP